MIRRYLICCTITVLAAIANVAMKPIATGMLIIDAAPSIVAYQGSSQTQTRFVIAPMGRSLGYVEPTYVNRTEHRTEKLRIEHDYDFLNVHPVYVHN